MRLAPTDHAPIYAVQPLLVFLCDAHNFCGQTFAPFEKITTGHVAVTVASSCLDQDAANVSRARLDDGASAILLAGAILRTHQAGKAHERRSLLEAPEVLRLNDQRQRAQRVDTFEATQAADGRPIRLSLRQVLKLLIKRL